MCTPDGAWVVFGSDRSGISTLWRVRAEGGEPEQLTSSVSYYPEISPDGKLIACIVNDAASSAQGVVAVLPITGGAPIKRLNGIPASPAIRWGPRPQMITFIRTEQDISNLFTQDTFAGAEQQLTHFENDQIFDFDWSPDRSRLAMVRGVDVRNVVMITNSKNHLRRKLR